MHLALSSFLETTFTPESYSPNRVETDFLAGSLKLNNLELRPDLLDSLELPVTLRRGVVGQLRVLIQDWARMGPIEVSVDNVFLLLETRYADEQWQSQAARSRRAAAKLDAVNAAHAAARRLAGLRRQRAALRAAAAASRAAAGGGGGGSGDGGNRRGSGSSSSTDGDDAFSGAPHAAAADGAAADDDDDDGESVIVEDIEALGGTPEASSAGARGGWRAAVSGWLGLERTYAGLREAGLTWALNNVQFTLRNVHVRWEDRHSWTRGGGGAPALPIAVGVFCGALLLQTGGGGASASPSPPPPMPPLPVPAPAQQRTWLSRFGFGGGEAAPARDGASSVGSGSAASSARRGGAVGRRARVAKGLELKNVSAYVAVPGAGGAAPAPFFSTGGGFEAHRGKGEPLSVDTAGAEAVSRAAVLELLPGRDGVAFAAALESAPPGALRSSAPPSAEVLPGHRFGGAFVVLPFDASARLELARHSGSGAATGVGAGAAPPSRELTIRAPSLTLQASVPQVAAVGAFVAGARAFSLRARFEHLRPSKRLCDVAGAVRGGAKRVARAWWQYAAAGALLLARESAGGAAPLLWGSLLERRALRVCYVALHARRGCSGPPAAEWQPRARAALALLRDGWLPGEFVGAAGGARAPLTGRRYVDVRLLAAVFGECTALTRAHPWAAWARRFCALSRTAARAAAGGGERAAWATFTEHLRAPRRAQPPLPLATAALNASEKALLALLEARLPVAELLLFRAVSDSEEALRAAGVAGGAEAGGGGGGVSPPPDSPPSPRRGFFDGGVDTAALPALDFDGAAGDGPGVDGAGGAASDAGSEGGSGVSGSASAFSGEGGEDEEGQSGAGGGGGATSGGYGGGGDGGGQGGGLWDWVAHLVGRAPPRGEGAGAPSRGRPAARTHAAAPTVAQRQLFETLDYDPTRPVRAPPPWFTHTAVRWECAALSATLCGGGGVAELHAALRRLAGAVELRSTSLRWSATLGRADVSRCVAPRDGVPPPPFAVLLRPRGDGAGVPPLQRGGRGPPRALPLLLSLTFESSSGGSEGSSAPPTASPPRLGPLQGPADEAAMFGHGPRGSPTGHSSLRSGSGGVPRSRAPGSLVSGADSVVGSGGGGGGGGGGGSPSEAGAGNWGSGWAPGVSARATLELEPLQLVLSPASVAALRRVFSVEALPFRGAALGGGFNDGSGLLPIITACRGLPRGGGGAVGGSCAGVVQFDATVALPQLVLPLTDGDASSSALVFDGGVVRVETVLGDAAGGGSDDEGAALGAPSPSPSPLLSSLIPPGTLTPRPLRGRNPALEAALGGEEGHAPPPLALPESAAALVDGGATARALPPAPPALRYVFTNSGASVFLVHGGEEARVAAVTAADGPRLLAVTEPRLVLRLVAPGEAGAGGAPLPAGALSHELRATVASVGVFASVASLAALRTLTAALATPAVPAAAPLVAHVGAGAGSGLPLVLPPVIPLLLPQGPGRAELPVTVIAAATGAGDASGPLGPGRLHLIACEEALLLRGGGGGGAGGDEEAANAERGWSQATRNALNSPEARSARRAPAPAPKLPPGAPTVPPPPASLRVLVDIGRVSVELEGVRAAPLLRAEANALSARAAGIPLGAGVPPSRAVRFSLGGFFIADCVTPVVAGGGEDGEAGGGGRCLFVEEPVAGTCSAAIVTWRDTVVEGAHPAARDAGGEGVCRPVDCLLRALVLSQRRPERRAELVVELGAVKAVLHEELALQLLQFLDLDASGSGAAVPHGGGGGSEQGSGRGSEGGASSTPASPLQSPQSRTPLLSPQAAPPASPPASSGISGLLSPPPSALDDAARTLVARHGVDASVKALSMACLPSHGGSLPQLHRSVSVSRCLRVCVRVAAVAAALRSSAGGREVCSVELRRVGADVCRSSLEDDRYCDGGGARESAVAAVQRADASLAQPPRAAAIVHLRATTSAVGVRVSLGGGALKDGRGGVLLAGELQGGASAPAAAPLFSLEYLIAPVVELGGGDGGGGGGGGGGAPLGAHFTSAVTLPPRALAAAYGDGWEGSLPAAAAPLPPHLVTRAMLLRLRTGALLFSARRDLLAALPLTWWTGSRLRAALLAVAAARVEAAAAAAVAARAAAARPPSSAAGSVGVSDRLARLANLPRGASIQRYHVTVAAVRVELAGGRALEPPVQLALGPATLFNTFVFAPPGRAFDSFARLASGGGAGGGDGDGDGIASSSVPGGAGGGAGLSWREVIRGDFSGLRADCAGASLLEHTKGGIMVDRGAHFQLLGAAVVPQRQEMRVFLAHVSLVARPGVAGALRSAMGPSGGGGALAEAWVQWAAGEGAPGAASAADADALPQVTVFFAHSAAVAVLSGDGDGVPVLSASAKHPRAELLRRGSRWAVCEVSARALRVLDARPARPPGAPAEVLRVGGPDAPPLRATLTPCCGGQLASLTVHEPAPELTAALPPPLLAEVARVATAFAAAAPPARGDGGSLPAAADPQTPLRFSLPARLTALRVFEGEALPGAPHVLVAAVALRAVGSVARSLSAVGRARAALLAAARAAAVVLGEVAPPPLGGDGGGAFELHSLTVSVEGTMVSVVDAPLAQVVVAPAPLRAALPRSGSSGESFLVPFAPPFPPQPPQSSPVLLAAVPGVRARLSSSSSGLLFPPLPEGSVGGSPGSGAGGGDTCPHSPVSPRGASAPLFVGAGVDGAAFRVDGAAFFETPLPPPPLREETPPRPPSGSTPPHSLSRSVSAALLRGSTASPLPAVEGAAPLPPAPRNLLTSPLSLRVEYGRASVGVADLRVGRVVEGVTRARAAAAERARRAEEERRAGGLLKWLGWGVPRGDGDSPPLPLSPRTQQRTPSAPALAGAVVAPPLLPAEESASSRPPPSGNEIFKALGDGALADELRALCEDARAFNALAAEAAELAAVEALLCAPLQPTESPLTAAPSDASEVPLALTPPPPVANTPTPGVQVLLVESLGEHLQAVLALGDVEYFRALAYALALSMGGGRSAVGSGAVLGVGGDGSSAEPGGGGATASGVSGGLSGDEGGPPAARPFLAALRLPRASLSIATSPWGRGPPVAPFLCLDVADGLFSACESAPRGLLGAPSYSLLAACTPRLRLRHPLSGHWVSAVAPGACTVRIGSLPSSAGSPSAPPPRALSVAAELPGTFNLRLSRALCTAALAAAPLEGRGGDVARAQLPPPPVFSICNDAGVPLEVWCSHGGGGGESGSCGLLAPGEEAPLRLPLGAAPLLPPEGDGDASPAPPLLRVGFRLPENVGGAGACASEALLHASPCVDTLTTSNGCVLVAESAPREDGRALLRLRSPAALYNGLAEPVAVGGDGGACAEVPAGSLAWLPLHVATALLPGRGGVTLSIALGADGEGALRCEERVRGDDAESPPRQLLACFSGGGGARCAVLRVETGAVAAEALRRAAPAAREEGLHSARAPLLLLTLVPPITVANALPFSATVSLGLLRGGGAFSRRHLLLQSRSVVPCGGEGSGALLGAVIRVRLPGQGGWSRRAVVWRARSGGGAPPEATFPLPQPRSASPVSVQVVTGPGGGLRFTLFSPFALVNATDALLCARGVTRWAFFASAGELLPGHCDGRWEALPAAASAPWTGAESSGGVEGAGEGVEEEDVAALESGGEAVAPDPSAAAAPLELFLGLDGCAPVGPLRFPASDAPALLLALPAPLPQGALLLHAHVVAGAPPPAPPPGDAALVLAPPPPLPSTVVTFSHAATLHNATKLPLEFAISVLVRGCDDDAGDGGAPAPALAALAAGSSAPLLCPPAALRGCFPPPPLRLRVSTPEGPPCCWSREVDPFGPPGEEVLSLVHEGGAPPLLLRLTRARAGPGSGGPHAPMVLTLSACASAAAPLLLCNATPHPLAFYCRSPPSSVLGVYTSPPLFSRGGGRAGCSAPVFSTRDSRVEMVLPPAATTHVPFSPAGAPLCDGAAFAVLLVRADAPWEFLGEVRGLAAGLCAELGGGIAAVVEALPSGQLLVTLEARSAQPAPLPPQQSRGGAVAPDARRGWSATVALRGGVRVEVEGGAPVEVGSSAPLPHTFTLQLGGVRLEAGSSSGAGGTARLDWHHFGAAAGGTALARTLPSAPQGASALSVAWGPFSGASAQLRERGLRVRPHFGAPLSLTARLSLPARMQVDAPTLAALLSRAGDFAWLAALPCAAPPRGLPPRGPLPPPTPRAWVHCAELHLHVAHAELVAESPWHAGASHGAGARLRDAVGLTVADFSFSLRDVTVDGARALLRHAARERAQLIGGAVWNGASTARLLVALRRDLLALLLGGAERKRF